MSKDSICLAVGPFNVSLRSNCLSLLDAVDRLYQDYPWASNNEFIDYHINLIRPSSLRRFYRPQIEFFLDEYSPFLPLSLNEALPLFEWGFNWCIGAHAHQYLIIHAAVLAKQGRGLILPGEPGSGKSTLCAALAFSGWQLLSDELTLIDLVTGRIQPVVRPISLKNESIDIITSCYPQAKVGSYVEGTAKGSVAHIQAPACSINRMHALADPSVILLPKYCPQTELDIESLDKSQAFMRVAENSFNYSILGEKGFVAVGDLVEQVECYRVQYNKLDNIIEFIEQLFDQP